MGADRQAGKASACGSVRGRAMLGGVRRATVHGVRGDASVETRSERCDLELEGWSVNRWDDGLGSIRDRGVCCGRVRERKRSYCWRAELLNSPWRLS